MNNSVKSLVLFVLCPFVSFLTSVQNLRNKYNQIVFVLFFGLFGFCHTFKDTRADSYRKYEYFNGYSKTTINDIYNEFSDGEIKDVYEEILMNFVRSFSHNPKVMMMIVGLVGGFFYMLVVKRFLKDRLGNLTYPLVILLGFMIIESNLCVMGGLRNFTAFPIFMYSAIRLLLDKKKGWIIGLIITPLIHFAYIPVVVAAILVYLVSIPSKFLHYTAVTACLLSIFLSTSSYSEMLEVGLGFIDNESISSRVDNYGDASTEDHFSQSLTTRLNRINNKISACFVAMLLIFIRKNKNQLIKTEYEEKLYNLLLFFISISFAFIAFSVVGQRYVYIAMILLYMLLLNLYQKNKKLIKPYIYAMPLVYSIHILYFIYNCYSNVGIDILYKPLPFLLM